MAKSKFARLRKQAAIAEHNRRYELEKAKPAEATVGGIVFLDNPPDPGDTVEVQYVSDKTEAEVKAFKPTLGNLFAFARG